MENDRLQRLSRLKTITEHVQDFDLNTKRSLVERLRDGLFSLEDGPALPQPEILQPADRDAIPSFQEEELPPPPLYPISSPLDIPVRIQYLFSSLIHQSDTS
jgi:hypothetical protein